MSFTPFALEAWQSHYEEDVAYNLADSGIDAVPLRDLVPDPQDIAQLLDTPLHYPAVGGGHALRSQIANLYPGASEENVLVTVGAAEANTLAVHAIAEGGEHAIVLEPGYRQVYGTLRNLGHEVDAFHLRADRDWRPDLDELAGKIRSDTRLVAIVNPNNPVGTILTDEELNAIVELCERNGAWLLVDEVYRGTEHGDTQETPTAWGKYERMVCIGSLSKAYGLPGLRTGWMVAPNAEIEAAWRRHEYFTISTSIMSMHLAEKALSEPTRSELIARTRRFIAQGWSVMSEWLGQAPDLVSAHTPEATALAFVKYHVDLPAEQVAQALRTEGDVLVGAGSHFGIEHHLRITHGVVRAYLEEALRRTERVLRRLQQDATAA
jgi:aspartate/methionine/tyrosine aminotransferase